MVCNCFCRSTSEFPSFVARIAGALHSKCIYIRALRLQDSRPRGWKTPVWKMPLLANCLAVHQKASTSTEAKDAHHESVERVGPSALRSRAALAWCTAQQHPTAAVLSPESFGISILHMSLLLTVQFCSHGLRTRHVQLRHGEHSCSSFIRPRRHLSIHNML